MAKTVSPVIQALFDEYNLFEQLVAQKAQPSVQYTGKVKVRKVEENKYRAHCHKDGLRIYLIGKVPNDNGRGMRICFAEAPSELGKQLGGNNAKEVTEFLAEINEALQSDLSQVAA